MTKSLFAFGRAGAEIMPELAERVGPKGAGLATMVRLGLPVPPGFTLASDAGRLCEAGASRLPDGLEAEVATALAAIEDETGKRLGHVEAPLFLSVRPDSIPPIAGVTDTVLNLGLNDETVEALATQSGDRRFAFDCYRRFIQLFAVTALRLDHQLFEDEIEALREEFGEQTRFTAQALEKLASRFKAVIERETGTPFPQDCRSQLSATLAASLCAWTNPRAVLFRRLRHVPEDAGVAVTVQAMVFGNLDARSGAGFVASRDPQTGVDRLTGSFVTGAQGDEARTGLLPRQTVDEAQSIAPEAFAALREAACALETHYRDAQEIEYTLQSGSLYLLQTAPARRTDRAALKIAVELAGAKTITCEEALMRVDPSSLDNILHPTIAPDQQRCVIASGLPASPGAAWGEIVFSADEAERLAQEGRHVILVRVETSPDDIHGMHAAQAILTARGGMTSHAAVVARGMGKPCVTGAGAIRVDERAGTMSAGALTLRAGDVVTLDGGAGEVLEGAARMIEPELSQDFLTLLDWADKTRRIRVRANADTPYDAGVARRFGAEGIGLCRSEHMFFDTARIRAVREMILSDDGEGRASALAQLLLVQRRDFAEIFASMSGLPVTVRLLDPPLHEFLPKSDADLVDIAASLGVPAERLRRRARELDEFNPMLGFRGCRLAIAFPEIADMQARAVFEAAVEAASTTGAPVAIEILVPLVATRAEFDLVKARIDAMAQNIERETGIALTYQVGTMIELPRAALRAGEIAQTAEFFSFGTNDLTQTAFGISRDDAGTFLGAYMQKGVLPADPFATIDREGVGELVQIACERGRATRPSLKIGICGEHGGDPASVRFFEEVGLDYVSCSPYRVPIARLAAARAVIALREA